MRDYLSDDSLQPLWAALRKRLEGNGLQVTGALTLDLDETGTDRLAGLLGRRVKRPTKVQLVELDAALRRSAGAAGLVTVIEALTGPLEDRKAVRAATKETRASTTALLDAALADAGISDQPWIAEFVDGVRVAGILTRAGDGAASAIVHAGAVLGELAAARALWESPSGAVGHANAWWELAELASSCTGDAHGLDNGRVASALVLRASAAAFGIRPPESVSEARALWSRLGVTPDEVSGTVMVWGLRPSGDDAWSAMMRVRADLGLVTHLTLHELRGAAADVSWAEPGTVVSVCENPQVLQAAARAGAAGPLVCTSGNPASAGWMLLRTLVAQRVRVRYHGDFDWAGVAIAGRVVSAGIAPWRLGAEDYAAAIAEADAVDRLSLSGRPVETPWDPQLAADMSRRGIAVHEESLLGVLLGDLGRVDGVP
jgi:uncharacterized protein (TIGR02679 family)